MLLPFTVVLGAVIAAWMLEPGRAALPGWRLGIAWAACALAVNSFATVVVLSGHGDWDDPEATGFLGAEGSWRSIAVAVAAISITAASTLWFKHRTASITAAISMVPITLWWLALLFA